jgi:hypothetical protein
MCERVAREFQELKDRIRRHREEAMRLKAERDKAKQEQSERESKASDG